MALVQSFEKTGNLLFKYRGQIPVLIFVLALPVLLLTNHKLYTHLATGEWNTLRIVMTIIAALISTSGLLLRAITVGTTPKGTSGRNTKSQVAEALNTKGIYSVVRHPLYLANYLIWAGLLVFSMNVMAIIIVSLVYWLYYERIMFAEETFLRRHYGPQFETWAARVPAVLPNFRLLERGLMSFSLKTVVRREYTALLSTIISYTIIDYVLFAMISIQNAPLSSLTSRQWIRPSACIMAIGILMALIVKSLKHYTKILQSSTNRS